MTNATISTASYILTSDNENVAPLLIVTKNIIQTIKENPSLADINKYSNIRRIANGDIVIGPKNYKAKSSDTAKFVFSSEKQIRLSGSAENITPPDQLKLPQLATGTLRKKLASLGAFADSTSYLITTKNHEKTIMTFPAQIPVEEQHAMLQKRISGNFSIRTVLEAVIACPRPTHSAFIPLVLDNTKIPVMLLQFAPIPQQTPTLTTKGRGSSARKSQ